MGIRGLTDEQRKEILERIAAGESTYRIGREYDIDHRCLCLFAKRNSIKPKGRKKLSASELDLMKSMYEAHASQEQVARELSLTPSCVSRNLRKMGVEIRYPADTSKRNVAIIEERRLGRTNDEIAKRHAIEASTVSSVVKKMAPYLKRHYQLKEKLPSDYRQRFIAAYESGLPTTKIATVYNVSSSSVNKVIKSAGRTIRNASHRVQKYTVDESFFDKIDNETKAYVLGFLYADGCNAVERNQVAIVLHSKDRAILDRINAALGSNRPVKLSTYATEVGKRKITASIARLSIGNKRISERLVELGCVARKSLILGYPLWLDDELHRHFIRGYFDGDGTIGFDRKRMVFRCQIAGTYQFFSVMNEIVSGSIGVRGTLHNPKNSRIYIYTIGGNRNARKFFSWLYDSADIFLERKYQRYQEYKLILEERDRKKAEMKEGTCPICNEGPKEKKGLCKTCYAREFWRSKHPDWKPRPNYSKHCTICGTPSHAQGLCSHHWWEKNYSDPEARRRRNEHRRQRRLQGKNA